MPEQQDTREDREEVAVPAEQSEETTRIPDPTRERTPTETRLATAETATARPETQAGQPGERYPFGVPGQRISRSSPFYVGFFGGLGVLTAIALSRLVESAQSILVLIVVSMFLAVGLNPLVEWLVRRGLRRSLAVTLVALGVVLAVAGFIAAIAQPLAEQTSRFIDQLPTYLNQLLNNPHIRDLDANYQIIQKAREFVTSGELLKQAFGGIFGAGVFVANTLFNTLTVLIMTLYFLGSLPAIKKNIYLLVPRSRRTRVQLLSDEILTRVGRYVGGAFLVAIIAGLVTYVFLSVTGVPYALPLAIVVALLDPVPMIGFLVGAALVTLVSFTVSLKVGVACLIFFLIYQQIENYLIVPRVVSKSVDVPPTLTIVAALLGGALAGIVGALLAIPVAAAILLLIREVVLPRQEAS